jgi:methionyl-tRNA formyltransferase
MFFIGGGAPLTQAVIYALKAGVKVDGACVPIADSSLPRLKRNNVFVIESVNPNSEVTRILDMLQDDKIFSINNEFLLENALLESGPKFFNIHNGLIQRYRGLAEVCVFAALCNGEKEYGVTLHQILPRQKVDSGPVIAQLKFDIELNDDYFELMKKSLEACQKIFETNLENIIGNKFESRNVELFPSAYSYANVAQVIKQTEPSNLIKARNFGFFGAFFPKLVAAVDSTNPLC